MKCDLHVHSYFSGLCTTPFVRKFCRESYSDPREVYAVLKERGMDLITLTEHDSIESAEELRKHKDFFVSEEVTCRMPSGTEVHVAVYDLTERQHVQIQQRRNDLIALLIYLTEKRLLFLCQSRLFQPDRRAPGRRLPVVPGVFSGDRDPQRADAGIGESACRASRQAMAKDRHRRQRRSYPALRRNGLHGSSRGARQGRIFRRIARRHGSRERRIWRLPQTDARPLSDHGGTDARESPGPRFLRRSRPFFLPQRF